MFEVNEKDFTIFIKNNFTDIDLVNQGLVMKVKTKNGEDIVGLSDNNVKIMAQKVGVNPQVVDKAKQLPPEQRKRVALKLLYMMMQDEEFKSQFLNNLKQRGVLYIPDTPTNRAFSKVFGFAVLILIIMLLLMIVGMLATTK